MEIEELEKPPGLWCRHRLVAGGCGIYGEHPSACKSFACLWLVTPDMPAKFRPDRTRVVLVHEPENGRLVAHCDPTNPSAWRREPTYSLLKTQAKATWASPNYVCVKSGLRLWLITPTTDLDIGEVDPRSPMKIDKAANGSARVEVLPPIPKDANVESHMSELRKGPKP